RWPGRVRAPAAAERLSFSELESAERLSFSELDSAERLSFSGFCSDVSCPFTVCGISSLLKQYLWKFHNCKERLPLLSHSGKRYIYQETAFACSLFLMPSSGNQFPCRGAPKA